MNIKNAKKQIASTVRAYLAKDSEGRYLIPPHKQRPVFLVGAPGIGKTEIMSQIASEMGIGLISYSMTHHTRQSAIGLPIIKHRRYGDEEFDITEYTMSEIISSVYELMESSGVKNGILFLDEINCISETLMPIMLGFLQYKVFGGHKLPEGWVVVTAGNPPEYNSSVREFDIVTYDRLKLIEVSPELDAWKEYAYACGVHSAVITYLEIKPQNFYKIESSSGVRRFVTARGWDDLGRALGAYEQLGIAADKELIGQYIRIDAIAEDFAVYYELYNKYRSDYKVQAVLSGDAGEDIKQRAKNAAFDERYSLLGLILEALRERTARVLEQEELISGLKEVLAGIKQQKDADISAMLRAAQADCRERRERLKASGGLSEYKDRLLSRQADALLELSAVADGGFEAVSAAYSGRVEQFKAQVSEVRDAHSNMFSFCEEVFGAAQELLILVTELAASPVNARFIAHYGCDDYYRYDKQLMFGERRQGIVSEIEDLLAE